MNYPTGPGLSFGYDGYGRLGAVYSNLGGTWATLADSFLYEPATARRYAWRFGNQLPRLVTLDNDGRVTQLASASVHNLGFGYTNVDTVSSRGDPLYGFSASFAYDAVDRLATVASSGDAQSFGYDQVGNRIAQSRQGASYGLTLAAGSNRFTSLSGPGLTRNFGFDGAGNVVLESRSDGTRTIPTTPSTA